MTQTRKRPHEAGADLRLVAGDRDEKYSEIGRHARPSLSVAYARPAWLDFIRPLPGRSAIRPAITWQGNVAEVRFAPIGFRLVEVEAGKWRLAIWRPDRRRGKRAWLFSDAGNFGEASLALKMLAAVERRPIYPPLRVGEAA